MNLVVENKWKNQVRRKSNLNKYFLATLLDFATLLHERTNGKQWPPFALVIPYTTAFHVYCIHCHHADRQVIFERSPKLTTKMYAFSLSPHKCCALL